VGGVVFVVVELAKLSVLVKSKFEAARARSWFWLAVVARDTGVGAKWVGRLGVGVAAQRIILLDSASGEESQLLCSLVTWAIAGAVLAW
jgi:hypothetical protein